MVGGMFCTSCGGPLRPGARFCAQCGAPQGPAPAAAVPEPSTERDAELAVRLRRGDEAAFGALYGRYARPVHDFVARIVREPATAEDVTQATFAQVWERRETLRSPEAVKRWIYQIAHHFALSQVVRGPATVPMEEELQLAAMEPGPEESAVSADAARLVWDAAASLEPHQLAILDLSVRCGLASSEIAEILAVDTARASLQVNRAKEALGNAVRYLLVARRRSHCERLAELVPAGVGQLSPEQRATVDHHMRRCPACQGMALRLTAPEELFGALLLLPLPRRLLAPPHVALAAHVASMSTAGRLVGEPPRPVVGHRVVKLLHPASRLQTAVAAAVGLALVGGAIFGVARIATGGGSRAASGQSQPGPVVGASPTSSVSTSSGSPSGSGGPGPSSWTVAQVDPNDNLEAVSCPTADLCVALGLDGSLLTSTDPTGGATAWSVTNVGDTTLDAVSCPTVSLCVAVGDDGNVMTSTDPTGGAAAWTITPADPSPGTIGLRAASCPSVDLCVLVDDDGDVVTSTDPTGGAAAWMVTSVDPTLGGNVSVACASANLCVVVGGLSNNGGSGEVVTSTNPTGGASAWTVTSLADPLVSVSCPSASLCVVVDLGGDLLTSADPTGGASAWTAADVDSDVGQYEPQGVSCPSVHLCVAIVDSNGDVATSTDPLGGSTSWTVTSVDAAGGVNDVSCPTVSLCVAVDGSGDVVTGP